MKKPRPIRARRRSDSRPRSYFGEVTNSTTGKLFWSAPIGLTNRKAAEDRMLFWTTGPIDQKPLSM